MSSPAVWREGFEYEFSRVDPVAGAHIDPPSTAIYETLVAKGPDGTAQPSLANRWEVTEDGTRWAFELRPGLRFHSGAACDAAAVVEALERCRWGDARTRQMHYWDPVATVHAEGERTVVLRTHYPTTRVVSLLWGTHTTIFNERLRARLGPDAFGETAADGTGPFRLVAWSPRALVAERAASYGGTPLPFLANRGPRPHLDRIEWVSALDPAERIALLEEGRIDGLHAPPAREVARFVADPRFRVASVPEASNVYLGLNWARRDLGFHDLRVRRAVSLAVDRSALVADLLDGRGRATYGPVPPGAEFYDPEPDRLGRHDPREAASLLEQAGWVPGPDGLRRKNGVGLSFDCVVQQDSVLEAAARLVQAQLRRVGVGLKPLAVRPFAPFYARLAEGPPSFLSKWLWPDPIDALAGFTSTSCQPRPNWQRASVPTLDHAFDVFRRAPDLPAAAEAAGTVQRLVASELPLIPLFTPEDVWICRSGTSGWGPVGGNLYPFYQDVLSA